jgi:hypothetical protein
MEMSLPRAKDVHSQSTQKPQQTQHEIDFAGGQSTSKAPFHLPDLMADHYFGERQYMNIVILVYAGVIATVQS